MELKNKTLFKLKSDLKTKSASTFKQDQKLVIAIDKLFRSVQPNVLKVTSEDSVLLPKRKLEFNDVRKFLSQSTIDKIPEKSKDILLKENNDARKSVIKKIEDILGTINRSAQNGEVPKLIIRNQKLWNNCIYDLDRVTLKSFKDAKKTIVSYSTATDKNRFNTIVFVLTKIHELLAKNITVTRRELFYHNVIRLKNQANLDVAVRDVCCLLDTPPWNLGIVATAKGLVSGPLVMYMRDGSSVDCMASGGTLVPQDINGIIEFITPAKYILVVEKDAVFQKLIDEGVLVRLGPVIILTGKGYPDVCTRQFLCRLCKELHLPALALVDADPHGLEIFLTYKYGSLAQSHLSASLACSSLQLLGARHRDVMTLASNEARLSLTQLDKRKLAALLRRPYLNTAAGARIQEELNSMLSSGMKAEIEALASNAAALCDAYLPSKIIQGEYIG